MNFRSWIQKFNYYTCLVGMFLLLPLMFLTTGDVLGRKILAKTIPGTFELSEYILAVFILLAAPYTQQIKGHVGVDFFISRLSGRSRLFCRLITNLLSLFIIAILIGYGWWEGIHEKAVSDMLRIPQYPFRLLVPVAGLFLWLELFFDLQDAFKKLSKGKKL
jgi:TRAP-type C4-dicarboxylate transport system permease small subunit